MLMFPWYAIHHRINFAEKASAVTDTAWINSIRYNEQMRGGELYCCDASGKIWTVAAHLQPDGKMKMGKEPKAWPKAHNLGARACLTHQFVRHCLKFLQALLVANAWPWRARCTLYPTTSPFGSTMSPAEHAGSSASKNKSLYP